MSGTVQPQLFGFLRHALLIICGGDCNLLIFIDESDMTIPTDIQLVCNDKIGAQHNMQLLYTAAIRIAVV